MWVAVIFGVIGYVFKKLDIDVAPIVLAMVLGGMTESNFRRALISSGGDPMVFVQNPVGVVCLVIAIAVFLYPIIRRERSVPELMH